MTVSLRPPYPSHACMFVRRNWWRWYKNYGCRIKVMLKVLLSRWKLYNAHKLSIFLVLRYYRDKRMNYSGPHLIMICILMKQYLKFIVIKSRHFYYKTLYRLIKEEKNFTTFFNGQDHEDFKRNVFFSW